jgi:hypothetical protein
MAYSGFKGVGPSSLGASKAQPKTLSDEQLVKELEAQTSTFSRPQFKTAQDQKNIDSLQAISPAKIRKATSTKVTKPKQPGDEGYVKPKETSKFMRKAGTRASGGGQDRKL